MSRSKNGRPAWKVMGRKEQIERVPNPLGPTAQWFGKSGGGSPPSAGRYQELAPLGEEQIKAVAGPRNQLYRTRRLTKRGGVFCRWRPAAAVPPARPRSPRRCLRCPALLESRRSARAALPLCRRAFLRPSAIDVGPRPSCDRSRTHLDEW